MVLTERHIVKPNKELIFLCSKAKELYNQALYYWRQSVFGNIEYFNELELVNLFREFNEPSFRALPSDSAQQTIKFLFKNIKSWQQAKKEFLKSPRNFLGKPRIPKYKNELSELYFTINQLRYKNNFIHFPKSINLKPIKVKSNNIDFCRIIPRADHFIIEFTYKVKETKEAIFNKKAIGIDLGLNNLITSVSTEGAAEIINGRSLKSINQFYNKKKSKLQSKLKTKKTSKRIQKISLKRNNKVNDFIHKTSRFIIQNALKKDISLIVIGNNKTWKQEINLGTKTNQNFVSIPHTQLIEKIKYKAKMVGIQVQTVEESYTSKCSALDLEEIKKHEVYLGKRVKRGLFKASGDIYINADANGALNILRKVIGDEFLKENFNSIASCVLQPVKINKF